MTVNVTVAADENYYALAATPITVTISDKEAQTVTASDVSASYGDTDKFVSATTNSSGEISYTVKSGSEEYIDVNPHTGALTIKNVPTNGRAYITVTAAETLTYASATKDVTVSIVKAALTVTAHNQTIIYGNQISQSAAKYVLSGVVTGDSASVTLTGNHAEGAATGIIMPTVTVTRDGANVSGNYEITAQTGVLILWQTIFRLPQ